MNTLEIKSIVEQALRDPRNFPFLVYALIFVIAAVGAYFGAYLRRKGQNFADKEDIERLTKIVEGVRSQHAKELENLAQENRKVIESMSQEHQLRLAALDRRLEVHQQAYALWLKLIFAMPTKQLGSVIIECQNWWETNCLYLDVKAREAFYRAFRAASAHPFLPKEKIEKNWDVITAAGPAIEQGVALPPIKDFKPEVVS
jgi:hypothetical protein